MWNIMSLFNAPLSEPSNFIVDEIELKRCVNNYFNSMKIPEWTYHFNRIFISPQNSFNVKYIIKFLSSKLAKYHNMSGTHDFNISDKNQLISQENGSNITESQSSASYNNINMLKHEDLVEDEDEFVIDDILDSLTSSEFLKLLQIVPEKRKETIMDHFHTYNSVLQNMSFDKLDTKLNNNKLTKVPYEIYTDKTVDILNEHNTFSNKVNKNILELLKTCGIIVIDVSRDITELSKGKEIFELFKKEIVNVKCIKKMLGLKNKILIVVISTVMTWANNVNTKKRAMNENDMHNRIPNPEFIEHYEFEQEVLAVNKTEGLKEIMMTIVIWTGLTYGFEQDLFNFIFDSACKNAGDMFLIPKNQNHVPVLHVENLARVVHKTISESHSMMNNSCVLAIESPINTLKQIVTALGKTCGVENSTLVSLDTFMEKYELKGIHKQMISADIIINSSINQLWPNFEWYDGKSSLVNEMKYIVETYKIEHNIKSIKLLILGPPCSGKTKLARKLAQHYKLIYMEPKIIVQNYINKIKEDLMSLRQTKQSVIKTSSIDLYDEVLKEVDPLIDNKILELDRKLNNLYSSMDANNGILEDIHLIPLFNEQFSHSFYSKHGYVLDGYPTTVDQAKILFNHSSSSQQIDVNKLPNLTICLTQKIPLNYSNDILSDDINNTFDENTFKKNIVKRRIAFSDFHTVFSSDTKLNLKSNSSVKTTKTGILKKSYSNDENNDKTKKSCHLIWDERNNNNLLKMLNLYYVPIKTIDSPYSPLDFDVDKLELNENDSTFEQFLNIVIKEIQLNQHDGLFDNNLNITNLIDEETNNEYKKFKQLKEKMTMLEDFEKIVTDFENMDNLSSDKYLTHCVTPTLTKLIVQMAKVRPSNPVDFLAHMALKENPEGLLDFPGYSKEGIRIQRLLEYITHLADHENTNIFEEESVSYE